MFARGNHDQCFRAGLGWHFLFSPDTLASDFNIAPPPGGKHYKKDVEGILNCPQHHSAYVINWSNGLSLGQMDTSNLHEATQALGNHGGIDGYNFENVAKELTIHRSFSLATPPKENKKIILELTGPTANYNDASEAKEEEEFYLRNIQKKTYS